GAGERRLQVGSKVPGVGAVTKSSSRGGRPTDRLASDEIRGTADGGPAPVRRVGDGDPRREDVSPSPPRPVGRKGRLHRRRRRSGGVAGRLPVPAQTGLLLLFRR